MKRHNLHEKPRLGREGSRLRLRWNFQQLLHTASYSVVSGWDSKSAQSFADLGLLVTETLRAELPAQYWQEDDSLETSPQEQERAPSSPSEAEQLSRMADPLTQLAPDPWESEP